MRNYWYDYWLVVLGDSSLVPCYEGCGIWRDGVGKPSSPTWSARTQPLRVRHAYNHYLQQVKPNNTCHVTKHFPTTVDGRVLQRYCESSFRDEAFTSLSSAMVDASQSTMMVRNHHTQTYSVASVMIIHHHSDAHWIVAKTFHEGQSRICMPACLPLSNLGSTCARRYELGMLQCWIQVLTSNPPLGTYC